MPVVHKNSKSKVLHLHGADCNGQRCICRRNYPVYWHKYEHNRMFVMHIRQRLITERWKYLYSKGY